MISTNVVILAGNLTRDPEVRQAGDGLTVADLGLACNERYRNKDGETVDKPCFVDVVVWGKPAEACGQYLKKGAPALVEGRLQFDQWQTKEGEKRNRLRVRADRVQFLGGNGRAKTDEAPPAAAGKRKAAAAESADDEALFA